MSARELQSWGTAGIRTTGIKRMFEGDMGQLDRTFKRQKFTASTFNNGKIDEKFTNGLVQTNPSTEKKIRKHLYINFVSPDIEGMLDNSGPSPSPPVTTEDVVFLRKADLSRARDFSSTGARITKFEAMFGDPLVDPVDVYDYDGGSSARANFLCALQQIQRAAQGKPMSRDEILDEWLLGGVVRAEEGPEGEPSRAQSIGRNTVAGTMDYEKKLITITHQGPVKVYDEWGSDLPIGTDLYYILKKVPLPRFYFLDPNTNPVNPRVKYTDKGRVLDDVDMLDAISDYVSVSGPTNIEEYKEQRREEMSKILDSSRGMVWQFIPFARYRGGPTKQDCSYYVEEEVDGQSISVLMQDGVAIKLGTIQQHKSLGHYTNIDPMRAFYDHNHVRTGRLLEIVVKMSRMYF